MAIRGRFPAYASIVLLLTLVSTATARYSGGTGEPNEPYQIATAQDLIALGETPADYDKHFILTADIDLDPNLPGRKVFDKAVIAPDTDRTKFDFQGTPFTGVFNGNDHAIWHLTIEGGSYVGLFGQMGYRAEVKNLGVVDVSTVGSSYYVGGLVGYTNAAVTRCYSTGAVSGGLYVGGLVGCVDFGHVSQCYSTCVASGTDHVGGLAGFNSHAVSQCYSTGVVSGGTNVGGLVGYNSRWGSMTHCYSIGRVGGGSYVGGLVGRNEGNQVMDCYWDTQASGHATSPGGTGKTTAEMQTASTFLSWGTCDYEGIWTIDEGRDCPKLRWENKSGKPIEARLTDFLEGKGTESNPYLIYTFDDIDATVKFSCEQDKHFRLGFVSGDGTRDNPYVIRTADDLNLLSKCPYEQDKHFRLGFVAGEGTQESPYLIETADQVELLSLCPYERDAQYRLRFVAGEGTQEEPYLISTAGQLSLLAACPYECGAHFALTADIDLDPNLPGREVFVQAVIAPGGVWGGGEQGACVFLGTPFTGVFDGNGHTISHLTIKGENNVGLFGRLESGAEVRNLGLVDVNVVGPYFYVGALAGQNAGVVTRCYSTGTISGGELVGYNSSGTVSQCYVTGDSSVGGLVGFNSGTMSQCYSAGTVTAASGGAGGLAGGNLGAMTNCYSTAAVSGNGSVGGLVGTNAGEGGGRPYQAGRVSQCYSVGSISGKSQVGGLVGYDYGYDYDSVRGCFWDVETSGQTTSAGGTGKTAAEMQTASTFLEAGWDFVGETVNGTEDIWWILEGKDYPRLWWEPHD